MNNLHRHLAPISDAAWADLEEEATRTFTAHVAARRTVDVLGPEGLGLSAVGTGHVSELGSDSAVGSGVRVSRREVAHVIELRVPFVVSRAEVDSVAKGAQDADWQPVKDAARILAYAEDRTVVDGLETANIPGVRGAASNPEMGLPADARDYPDAVAKALSVLRLAGVAGPYKLLLSAEAYTLVAETTDHGYPIREHVSRVLGSDGEIIWAPAITGALLLSTRGGDYELHLGEDVSIGYTTHDAESIELYFEETLAFIVQSAEAAVSLV